MSVVSPVKLADGLISLSGETARFAQVRLLHTGRSVRHAGAQVGDYSGIREQLCAW
jgi:ferric-dicitrate binding protein FerR (iron transport regulator)